MSKNSRREEIIARLVELIQAERLRRKLSLNEVATRSGLSHTMVMRVEKRERLPTIDTLLRITDALEIDLSAVLGQAMRAVKRSNPAGR
ncbi:MAG: XRE family transcriptional regulator [Chthoniobacterales bacterium]|nr:MAG: XRE family transcriptional regulator [Chthoniobacterales bacterium]